MATSSIPAAIDYLVASVAALPEVAAAAATVHDGFPAGTGQTAVAVGVVPHEEPTTPSDVVEAQLGANMEWEDYSIPCELVAWVGGGEEAAKPARDAAFTLYNAIVTLVRSNRTLGGALHSNHALVTAVRVDQTSTPTQAGEGRTCSIKFVVRCKNKF